MSHTIVKIADVFGLRGQIKMATNPPQCIIDADHCIIFNGQVKQYVGIGWTDIREAAPEDYDTLKSFFHICLNFKTKCKI